MILWTAVLDGRGADALLNFARLVSGNMHKTGYERAFAIR